MLVSARAIAKSLRSADSSLGLISIWICKSYYGSKLIVTAMCGMFLSTNSLAANIVVSLRNMETWPIR